MFLEVRTVVILGRKRGACRRASVVLVIFLNLGAGYKVSVSL